MLSSVSNESEFIRRETRVLSTGRVTFCELAIALLLLVTECSIGASAVSAETVTVTDLKKWTIEVKVGGGTGADPTHRVRISSDGTMRVEKGDRRGRNWIVTYEGSASESDRKMILECATKVINDFHLVNENAKEVFDAVEVSVGIEAKGRKIVVEMFDLQNVEQAGKDVNSIIAAVNKHVPADRRIK